MKKFLISAALFALPVAASAAGFAKQSIFLSKSAPVAGDTVLIHASVSNDTTIKFNGTLKVHDDVGTIGSVPVTLAAGEANDVSVSWKPTAGAHTIVADLTDSAGTIVEENSQTFSIAARPTPEITNSSDQSTGSVQPSTQIQQSIGSVSPAAEQYSAPVFKVIDSGRTAAAQQLNKAIDWSKQQAGVPSNTKGGSVFTSAAPSASKGWSAGGILSTVLLYVLSVLLFVVSNAGIFYPLLAIIFFYILWRCWRRYRRRY